MYPKIEETLTLASQPGYSRSIAMKKLMKALPKSLESRFICASLEGDSLVLFFEHPAAVMEFGYQKEHILEEMRKIYAGEKLSSSIRFSNVRAKAKNQPSTALPEVHEEIREKATGNFHIGCTDTELIRSFERIQHILKQNYDTQ